MGLIAELLESQFGNLEILIALGSFKVYATISSAFVSYVLALFYSHVLSHVLELDI